MSKLVCRITHFWLIVVGAFTVSNGAAQAQKDKPKLDEKGMALLKIVEEAAKAKDVRVDKTHGGGNNPYEDYPTKPGFLTGLTLWPGFQGKNQIIRGVQPIYQTVDGRKLGKKYGWLGTGGVVVEAKAGYAVGGLKMHTSFGTIQGMSVVFMKIKEDGLDSSDSYDSKWFGHKDPTTAFKVGMDGNPILGIHGLVHEDLKNTDFGLGLIIMGEKKRKKSK